MSSVVPPYVVRDISMAPSGRKIAWAYKICPFSGDRAEFTVKPFSGMNISVAFMWRLRPAARCFRLAVQVALTGCNPVDAECRGGTSG